MRKVRLTYISALVVVLTGINGSIAHAQQNIKSHSLTLTINQVALLDLEPAVSSISLIASTPSEAGAPVTEVSNNSSWLNYTSCVATTSPARLVSVQLTGTLPPGVELRLRVSPFSGAGQGVLGTSAGTVTLSATATTIVSGIRGCYTGNGANNGHQLTYTLVISNYAALEAAGYNPFLVSYTISN